MADKYGQSNHSLEARTLHQILDTLSVQEDRDFWGFIGQDSKAISHRSVEYSHLCVAVQDAERKGASTTLPRAARRLSALELQRAICRLRHRLLSAPGAVSYAARLFPRWIQFAKLPALLAVLDVVGCPHDERGVLTGTFPELIAENAKEKIFGLTEKFSGHELALVCAALILNGIQKDDRWRPLDDALQALIPYPADEPNSTVVEDFGLNGKALFNISDSSHAPQTAVSASNEQHLSPPIALGEWSVAGRVEPTELSEKPLFHASLEEATPKAVSEIQCNWSEEETTSGSLEEISRTVESCLRITHKTDDQFSGCAEISRICEEIQGDMSSKRITRDDQRVEDARALLTVINRGDDIDDQDADRLQEAIQRTFGRVVATAAIRGRLQLFHAAAPESMTDTGLNSVTSGEPIADSLGAGQGPELMTVGLASSESGHEDMGDINDDGPSKSHLRVRAMERFQAFDGSFNEEFWVAQDGEVEVAPWTADDYIVRLSSVATSAWDNREYALAYLHGYAAQLLGGDHLVDIDDFKCADELLSNPASTSAAISATRMDRLRNVLSSDRPTQQAINSFGVAVMLEVLRPTLPCNFSEQEIMRLVEMARFKDRAIGAVVSWALTVWSVGASPMPQLREAALSQPSASAAELKEELATAERRFRDTIASNWSAAGGRIQRTHCRHAWSRFINQEIVPLRSEFGYCSTASRSNAAGIANKITPRIVLLSKVYAEMMVEARFQDRAAADAAVQQIVASLLDIAEVLQRIATLSPESHAKYDACPVDEVRRVMNETSSDATDQLCAALFKAALAQECDINPLRLSMQVLIDAQDIIKCLEPSTLSKLYQAPDRISIQTITDIRLASAHVLNVSTITDDIDVSGVFRTVRELAIERERRDILSVLAATSVLGAHERNLLLKSALEIGETIFELVGELERVWSNCDALMVPDASLIKTVVDEARQLAACSDKVNSLIHGKLVESWLRLTIELATKILNDAVAKRVELAYGISDEMGRLAAESVGKNDYATLSALLYEERANQMPLQTQRVRHTLWRKEAMDRYPEPRRALVSDLAGTTDAQQKLVKTWVDTPNDHAQREEIRRTFYAVVSGEAEHQMAERRKRSVVKLSDLRDHKERRTVINCATLREYFQASGLNPTFLPQIADISQIVLIAAAPQATRSQNALDELARIVSFEPENTLVVFIEPGLPVVRRDELSEGLRRRRLLAAIVDDLDLCRICAAVMSLEGIGFLALLEILFEQLDAERLSPFSTQDGQHIRVETFVGRAEEAQELALRGKYSCIFSGRKLGKSALLKYVTKKYDHFQLASGNVLNVIFITIAGGESEHWVAGCIVEEMSRRFGLAEEAQGRDRPRDRLSSYMRRFLQERPTDNVLLILDEADTFVEGQLARYDLDREASLSFCLLKDLPQGVDKNGIPRIRTVFSGYRITNTRDGVWANAGDVLVLRPLRDDESVQFLTGAFARLGIDIAEFAPYIARRCGRQPAVLIRFGECLLRRLSRIGFGGHRETVRVSKQAIIGALNDQGVLDEIRTVVANNFQGNRVAHAVFGATLMALKELAPGHALTDAPVQVLEKLREIDSDLGWLDRVDASPSAIVERYLQDFIERELLTVADAHRFGVREYRLKFPHFLPVLTESETSLDVRQHIQAIRESTKQSRLSRCAISDTALEKIRYWFREPEVDSCKLIIVAGHWLSSLSDEKCGIADRLGCAPAEILRFATGAQVAEAVAAGVRVFVDPDESVWEPALAAETSMPIVVVAGIDWLRRGLGYVLEGGEIPIEVVGQGRLTNDVISWWIENARALHIKSPIAVDAIREATGGTPLLTGAFNALLDGAPGMDLRQEDLQSALNRFEQVFVQTAQLLVTGDSGVVLTKRELELLHMAVRVAGEPGVGIFDLESEFPLYWDVCAGPDSDVNPPLSIPEDRLSIQLLISCGLLPVTDESASGSALGLGQARIDPKGAAAQIVAVINREP